MFRTTLMFIIAALPFACGCGTIEQHHKGKVRPYAGVRYDAAVVGHPGDPALAVVFALDLPLSAVADTLLLPYDLSHASDE